MLTNQSIISLVKKLVGGLPNPESTVCGTFSSYRGGDGVYPHLELRGASLGHASILDGWLNPQKPMFGENLRWLYRKGVAGYQYERIRTLNNINVRQD
jgi:hypothetical protein